MKPLLAGLLLGLGLLSSAAGADNEYFKMKELEQLRGKPLENALDRFGPPNHSYTVGNRPGRIWLGWHREADQLLRACTWHVVADGGVVVLIGYDKFGC